MEQLSIYRINHLHPKLRKAALDAYVEAVKATPIGVHPFITNTFRTFEEQSAKYAIGRTVVNPNGRKSAAKPLGNTITDAKAGQSYHNYGLALDFDIEINGVEEWDVDKNWMIVVNCFKKHGFTWGGDWSGFKDTPHLENKLGYTWQDLLVKYNKKDFIIEASTNYINLKTMSDKWSILSVFLPEVEGFIPYPRWDYKQWSWGYGTAAGFDKNKKPSGSITKKKALADALEHSKSDYTTLLPKITKSLTESQWAALLSFSYNEGVGNAENLISDINSNSANLEHHFKRYIFAGGNVNSDLVDRRNKEWNLWNS